MKSGKLFASVALAALTAACSQESLQFEAAPGLQERPTVNVELSFDEDAVEFASEETRTYFGKPAGQGYQWIFEEGDKIGGLLMDEWNGEGCGIKNFSIVDYVHTNYAFIRETGEDGKPKWVTPAQAPVCEGNYFFYFPYNDSFNHRGYVAWDVNPIQPQYNDAGELFQMQAVKENQKWIGYKYVGHEMEGKVNKIDFDFVPLFAMPTFDFINMTGAELTVNKIDVRVTSNDAAAINPWGQHSLMATTMVLAPETGEFDDVNDTWEEKTFAEHTSMMYQYAQRYTKFGTDEDYVWPIGIDGDSWSWDASKAVANNILFPLNENHTANSIRRQAAYNYTADFSQVEGGYKVGPTEHIQALLVMPAGYYYWNTGKDGENTRTNGAWWSGQTFEALVYVTTPAGDDYVVRLDLGRPQTQGATNGSNFDDVNSGAAPKFLAPGVTTKFLASFDASALQSYNITDFKVTSTEELAWLIKETETNQGYYDLNVTTSGKRVAFDNTIDSLLAARPKVRLNVHGEITITADSDDAINKLYFNNPMLFTKLNIETAQVKKAEPFYAENNDEIVNESKILNNCEIFVAKSGSLDTKKNGIDIIANITNEGVVTAQNIKGDVENKGTMNADKIEGPVTNRGTLTAKIIDGIVNNSGTITINEKVTQKVTNTGTATIANAEEVIENKGTMTLKGAEYKKAVSNTKTMTVAGKSTFKSTLSNAAGATITFDADATCENTFTNDGTANVNSAVTVNVKNKAINKGRIDVKEGAKLVGANNDPVEIENRKNATINNNGTVHNVFNEGSIITGSKSYTVINSKPGAGEDAAAVGGEGYVNNSALGDVSYQNDATQTVELIINDITGMNIVELQNKISNADANKMTIVSGTIEFGGTEACNCMYGYGIYGHYADNEAVTLTSSSGEWGATTSQNVPNSYFGKGVVLGNVTIKECKTPAEARYPVLFFTNKLTVSTALYVDLNADVAILQSTKTGALLDVNGKLTVADHGRLRGSNNARLTIDFKDGEVHNAGVIQYTAEKYEAAPGNTWTGNATK